MPIDPRLSLQAKPADITGALRLGLQVRQQRAAEDRANALLELKQQEFARQQQETDRKDILRKTASESLSDILPMYEQGKSKEDITKALLDKSMTKNPKMQQVWLDVLNAHDKDPERAKAMLQRAVGRGRLEKLIPERFTVSDPTKYTQSSLRVFEKTGRQADLVPATQAKKGLDRVLTVNEMQKLKGPKGQSPELGMTLREARNAGFKVQKKLTKQVENKLRNVNATLSKLEELALGPEKEGKRVGGVFTAKPGAVSRIWDDVKKTWNRVAQDEKEQALYESFSKGTVSQLCRAAGEKGNLSNKDVDRCLSLVPSAGEGLGQLPDTRQVAANKIKQMRQWFDDILGKEEKGDLTPEEQAELEDLRKRQQAGEF